VVFGFLPDVSSVTLIACTINRNEAEGGDSGVGGNGGNGLGGVLSVLAGTATFNGGRIAHNRAEGGDGGMGGNGFGGGAYVNPGATLGVTGGTIIHNRASGGNSPCPGKNGQGKGGGVYNLGSFTFDALTEIAHNRASTSNDDLFP
jgi:hypothetical protein